MKFLFAAGAMAGVAVAGRVAARDMVPADPFDPNTTKYCSWWYDNDGSIPCSQVPDANFISMADFLRWVSLMIYESLSWHRIIANIITY
jgi:hypothetical protein